MLWILSPLAIPIGRSLFLGHAQSSFDYPMHDIFSLDLQGLRVIDYRRVVI